MKKGHKEYRIFTNLNLKNESEYENQLELWKKDKDYAEKRIDLYVFPLDLEKDINQKFGLKFRKVSIKNDNFSVKKLELKIRNEKSVEGIENWIKIIEKKIDSLNILTAINSTTIPDGKIVLNLNGVSYSLNLEETLKTIKNTLSAYNTSEVLNYSKAFDSSHLGFVFTFKNRSGESYEEDVMLKAYYFEVNKTENEKLEAKICYKRSLCVEYEVNKNSIENLNKKLGDYTVGGFPEELLNLFIKK